MACCPAGINRTRLEDRPLVLAHCNVIWLLFLIGLTSHKTLWIMTSVFVVVDLRFRTTSGNRRATHRCTPIAGVTATPASAAGSFDSMKRSTDTVCRFWWSRRCGSQKREVNSRCRQSMYPRPLQKTRLLPGALANCLIG
ncbi:hypothetical protein L209DRAFT_239299 [Thermothelomyces heterothallicus CBS 203.75]